MKILFDIGANNGNQWYNVLSSDQEGTLVYMFEPTPELCDVIKAKYAHLKNWVLIEKAVSNFEGTTTFNVAGHYDWGCSSLLEFKEDITNTWPEHRTLPTGDLHFTNKIEVDVITMESFLKSNPHINNIDYLHVDTQGSDLNVLKGFKDYLKIISSGVIEAALDAPLYNGSPLKDECIEWLETNGFQVNDITGGPHECDISFTRL
jgi:FkbM family methyltransferase